MESTNIRKPVKLKEKPKKRDNLLQELENNEVIINPNSDFPCLSTCDKQLDTKDESFFVSLKHIISEDKNWFFNQSYPALFAICAEIVLFLLIAVSGQSTGDENIRYAALLVIASFYLFLVHYLVYSLLILFENLRWERFIHFLHICLTIFLIYFVLVNTGTLSLVI